MKMSGMGIDAIAVTVCVFKGNVMKIQVTENKSVGTINPYGACVRVFVADDFHYGYFVHELSLYGLLSEDQQEKYLQTSSVTLDVSADIAQKIIDMGQSPYGKLKVN